MLLTVIGGGNMGLTYAKGIHSANILSQKIHILEKGQENLTKLKSNEPQFEVVDSPEDCISKANIIMLAVKPFHIQEVFESIKQYISPNQLVISLMAGVKIETIQNGLGLKKVVRSMPNLPAMIGKGMTTFTAAQELTTDEKHLIQKLLACTGDAVEVADEEKIDQSTGLSGSGSAYIFYFMEGLMNAAREFGFSDEDAKRIVTQTFDGAVDLYRKNDDELSTWIDRVCSKGGTTIAAINSFEDKNVKQHIKEGAYAAYNRAVELGNS